MSFTHHSRGIIFSTLINLVLCIPFCSAQSKTRQASSPRINTQTPGRCNLQVSQSPSVFKLRLGMSLREVVARLPHFPQLVGFAEGKSDELYLKDGAGDRGLLARRDRRDGVVSIEVRGSFLKRQVARGLSPVGVRGMTLLFMDRRLVFISLSDWESRGWGNTDEFVKKMSRVYGFAGVWWQRAEVKSATPDAPLGYWDFYSPVTGFECDGFKIEASCVGPPAPPGLCTLSIRDTRAKQAADKRKPDEESKQPQR
ncbi:MAG TPA: hypothetical protein VIQ24_20605 [Pyrinomonadaceae bacterium]